MTRRTPVSVLVALAAAGLVLALAAAAAAPLRAATGDAAAVRMVAGVDLEEAGLTISGRGQVTASQAEEVRRALESGLGGRTGGVRTSVRLDPMTMRADGGELRVRPVAATDLHTALRPVTGSPTAGLAVPAVVADELDVTVGEVVTLQRGSAETEAVVSSIVEPLRPEAMPAPLEAVTASVAAAPRDDRPADLVVGSLDTVLSLGEALTTGGPVTWQATVPSDLGGAAEARAVQTAMVRAAAAAEDPSTELGAAIEALFATAADTQVGTRGIVSAADSAVAAVTLPVRAVGLAGQVIALAVVAAAGLFHARRREVELRLAAVRGRRPALEGVIGAFRATPPLLLGAAGGTAVLLGIVDVVSPGDGPAGDVVLDAVRAVGVALVAALLVVVGVTAAATRRTVRVGTRRRRRFELPPWELLALALAGAGFAQLRFGAGGSATDGAATLHPLILAFPVVLLVGGIGAVLRLLRRSSPRLRRMGRDLTPVPFLVVRRLASAIDRAPWFLGASALALGLVVYASTLTNSLDVAMLDKARVEVGADAVVDLAAVSETPAGLPVAEVLRSRGRLQPTGREVDVLLIDPATFAEVAHDLPAGGSSRDLRELIAPLAGGDERLPILLVDGDDTQDVVVEAPGFRAPVEIVATPPALAGLSAERPLVVADRSRAAALDPAGGDVAGWWRGELWAAGRDATTRLVDAGARPDEVRSPERVAQRPDLAAVHLGLDAFRALALLATVLALTGLLLFLGSREEGTRVASALLSRMGLGRRARRRALAGELLALLGSALVLATVLGLFAAWLAVGAADPLAPLPPAPRLIWPWRLLSGLAATLLVAAVAGAAALDARARRVDLAEVLRG